jgi:hypothetical protein
VATLLAGPCVISLGSIIICIKHVYKVSYFSVFEDMRGKRYRSEAVIHRRKI